MTLNQNSTSARLYKWLYNTESLPNNLCPYFWKVVLAYLIIVPYFLLALPYLLGLAIRKESSNKDSFRKRIGMGFVIYAMIWFALCAIAFIGALFITPEKNTLYQSMIISGFFVWVCGITWGIVELISTYKEKRRRSRIKYNAYGYRIYEEPKANLIVEFIKAKYGKYCPKIDWK